MGGAYLAAMFVDQVSAIIREVGAVEVVPRFRALAEGDVMEKSPGDLVTIADQECERVLAERLQRVRDIPVVGEEGTAADPTLLDLVGSADATWIIDPIDGTHNFAHGKPPFGIIIARSEGGLCTSGWIYDCLTGRFCSAHSGQGAFLNGEQVTAKPAGRDKPVAAISMLFLTPDQQDMVNRTIAPHYDLVDIPRCAAEQYPRLALGENDVSSFKRTLPWDHAAGILWLNEAGGKAARLDDTPYRVDEADKPEDRRGLVGASSPQIWNEFIARVRANAS